MMCCVAAPLGAGRRCLLACTCSGVGLARRADCAYLDDAMPAHVPSILLCCRIETETKTVACAPELSSLSGDQSAIRVRVAFVVTCTVAHHAAALAVWRMHGGAGIALWPGSEQLFTC
jgi:hypothetical protein